MGANNIRGKGKVNLISGILVVIFAGAWLIVLADRVILPLISQAEIEVSMPDLRLKTYVQADSLCRAQGIELLPARIRSDDNLPPGLVIDQYPAAEAAVKPGRRVEVVVTGNSGLIVCPDLVGKSPREAALLADSSALSVNLDGINYQYSETDPEGIIIAQNPLAMTGLMKGSEVKLTVSLGIRPDNPVVPDLLGANLENVALLLRKQGLRLRNITKFPDRTHLPGTVIQQSVEPGEPAVHGASVDIGVAVAPIDPGVGKDSASIEQQIVPPSEEQHD